MSNTSLDRLALALTIPERALITRIANKIASITYDLYPHEACFDAAHDMSIAFLMTTTARERRELTQEQLEEDTMQYVSQRISALIDYRASH